MVLTNIVEIKLNNRNRSFYESKGYDVSNIICLVKIEDLSNSSKVKIKCKCDICSKEKEIKYCDYIKNTKNHSTYYSCSHKCSVKKIKTTNIERYGVESNLQTDDTKSKIKETCLDKYGVDNPSKNLEVKEKLRNTNIERYGVGYPIQNNEIKEKIKDTNNTNILNKYKNNIVGSYNVLSYKDISFNIKHYKCSKVFNINRYDLKNRLLYDVEICTMCNPINNQSSDREEKLKNYITSLNIDFIENDRTILEGKELDIYIPELNIAIEFNGLYWHSELYKSKDYHLNKTIVCKSKGVQLLHIWEDDWVNKREIIESIIKNKLGKIDNRIYARKTEVREVKSNIAREFLDINHIQGFTPSTYKLGLYHDNELVSLMTFGYRYISNKKEFELVRFCNKLDTNIIGASSKLYNYFLNNYNIDESYILSYVDISLFDGKMYETLGFNVRDIMHIDYHWVVKNVRVNRRNYQKHKLVKEGYSKDMTEVEIMHSRNYYRIWGCGQKRYEYKLNKLNK